MIDAYVARSSSECTMCGQRGDEKSLRRIGKDELAGFCADMRALFIGWKDARVCKRHVRRSRLVRPTSRDLRTVIDLAEGHGDSSQGVAQMRDQQRRVKEDEVTEDSPYMRYSRSMATCHLQQLTGLPSHDAFADLYRDLFRHTFTLTRTPPKWRLPTMNAKTGLMFTLACLRLGLTVPVVGAMFGLEPTAARRTLSFFTDELFALATHPGVKGRVYFPSEDDAASMLGPEWWLRERLRLVADCATVPVARCRESPQVASVTADPEEPGHSCVKLLFLCLPNRYVVGVHGPHRPSTATNHVLDAALAEVPGYLKASQSWAADQVFAGQTFDEVRVEERGEEWDSAAQNRRYGCALTPPVAGTIPACACPRPLTCDTMTHERFTPPMLNIGQCVCCETWVLVVAGCVAGLFFSFIIAIIVMYV